MYPNLKRKSDCFCHAPNQPSSSVARVRTVLHAVGVDITTSMPQHHPSTWMHLARSTQTERARAMCTEQRIAPQKTTDGHATDRRRSSSSGSSSSSRRRRKQNRLPRDTHTRHTNTKYGNSARNWHSLRAVCFNTTEMEKVERKE